MRIHIAHYAEHHISRVIKGPVAGVQGVGSDLGNGFHRSQNRLPDRMAVVEATQQILIYLPVRVVIVHADLLSDNALLLMDALGSKVGRRDEAEQHPQMLWESVGAGKVVGCHVSGGKSID